MRLLDPANLCFQRRVARPGVSTAGSSSRQIRTRASAMFSSNQRPSPCLTLQFAQRRRSIPEPRRGRCVAPGQARGRALPAADLARGLTVTGRGAAAQMTGQQLKGRGEGERRPGRDDAPGQGRLGHRDVGGQARDAPRHQQRPRQRPAGRPATRPATWPMRPRSSRRPTAASATRPTRAARATQPAGACEGRTPFPAISASSATHTVVVHLIHSSARSVTTAPRGPAHP